MRSSKVAGQARWYQGEVLGRTVDARYEGFEGWMAEERHSRSMGSLPRKYP